MKPWGRFLIIFIAYSFALLHTAVPHQHAEDDLDGRTVISQAGCHFTHSMSGFLQMVFSTDLGYGHLETFQKGTDTNIDFSIAFIYIIALFLPLVSVRNAGREYCSLLGGFIENLQKRLLLFSSTQFRAPPASDTSISLA